MSYQFFEILDATASSYVLLPKVFDVIFFEVF